MKTVTCGEKMNVLTVLPRYVRSLGDFYQFPLGLAYIAGEVKRTGFSSFGLNLNHKFGKEEELVTEMV